MLSVFMPVYNEESVLERSVGKTLEALQGSDFELFIVDDTSTDGTLELAAKLAAENHRIRYVRYENGPSRRENLADAFKRASGEVIAFLDADLSAGPEYLPGMVRLLGGADIVVGSRYLRESETKRGLFRLAVSRLYNLFLRLYFKSRIRDHQCGLKVFKRDVILRLVGEAGYDRKLVRGFSWDAEILLRAQRHGYTILEIPVKWVQSDRTSTRPLRELKMIPYLLGLRLRL